MSFTLENPNSENEEFSAKAGSDSVLFHVEWLKNVFVKT